MADEKISAMPAVTSGENADILTLLRAGVNSQITLAQLLALAAGQALTLSTAGGSIVISAAGSININQLVTESVSWFHGIDAILQVSPVAVTLSAMNAAPLTLSATGGTMQLDAAGAIILTPAGGQRVTATYIPLAGGNWAAGPIDLVLAIDRLAAAVAGLLGGTIP